MMEKLQPKLRFPEFEGNWDINNLRSIIEFKTGFAFQSEKMFSQIKDYQLLKMSNIYKNELQLERNPSYWDKIDDKTSEFLLKKGDCILTLTGTVGKKDFGYSVQIKENNKFLLNQRLVLLRETKNKSLNDFIRYILLNEKFLYLFFNEAKGGTGNQTNVGIDDLKNISLPFPSLPEQQKIASFLTTVDDKISNLKQKISLLEKYKKGVMQQIFSQQIRFKDENGNDYPEWEEKCLGEVSNKISSNISANKIEENFGDYIIYGASGILKKVDFYLEKDDYISIVKDGAGIGRIFYCKGQSSVLGTLDIIRPNKNLKCLSATFPN